MSQPYDPQERDLAALLSRRTVHWLVLWGPYSRRYWAFACFGPATVVSAPGPRELLAQMRQAELAAHASQSMAPARPSA
jgi:hypothetical protein